ncbi:MAG: hypothetical protein ACRDT6_05790 [Micromonosporaceae bacterium]
MRARLASIVLLVAVVLSGLMVVVAGGYEVALPDREPEGPFRAFLAIWGLGVLLLIAVSVAPRFAPRLWEYATPVAVAVVATWGSLNLRAYAHQCCETSWVIGYGYPFGFRRGGVTPSHPMKEYEAEALLWTRGGPGGTDTVALVGDLLFWGAAAFLAYVPLRLLARWAWRRFGPAARATPGMANGEAHATP